VARPLAIWLLAKSITTFENSKVKNHKHNFIIAQLLKKASHLNILSRRNRKVGFA
jgi:hypothetical protein